MTAIEADNQDQARRAVAAQAREFEQDLTAKYADMVRDHDSGNMSDAEFAQATAKVEQMRSRVHVIEGELPQP